MDEVTCTTCHRQFPRLMPGTDQAIGCDVEVRQVNDSLLASGHYGSSKFDGDQIDLTQSSAKPTLGVTCDDCIQKALDAGGKIIGNYLGLR